MKALTVRQPWASSIIHLRKDVENRTRRTSYRGRLYIHAALSFDDIGYEGDLFNNAAIRWSAVYGALDLSKGMVIGTVYVVGCHHSDECKSWTRANDLCSKWAQTDAWHWELANPLPTEIPFEAKGQLGIWTLGPSSVEELAS